MPIRILLALLAVAVGGTGLALNFVGMSGVMAPPQNRSFVDFLVYFGSYLTNLSNIVIVLIYLAELTGSSLVGWLRNPVFKAGMAGIMMLVMFFYHFMLAPYLPPLPATIEISNILLHYATPVLFLIWWVWFTPHGALRYRDVPLMLLPGLAYVAYIELRGPIAGEYPYTILDPNFALPDQSPGGYLAVAISVGVLVLLVALFDLLLVLLDSRIARRAKA